MGFWNKPKAEQPGVPGLSPEVTARADAIGRLGFSPPQFLRKAWVSDAAEALHGPRIAQAARAWTLAEQRSASTVRPCALIVVDAAERKACVDGLRAAGLEIEVLRIEDVSPPGAAEPSLITHLAAGGRADVRRFRKAWIASDNATMGTLLGYPACCRAFFAEVFSRRRLFDPVWLTACATQGAVFDGDSVTASGPPETNVLLRRLGVRAVPHLPCSFSCAESVALAQAIHQLGCSLGHAQEMAWLNEMLDWNISWSARNGLAEIRTPVLKLATHTDACKGVRTLRRPGGTTPDLAAHGLDFPYLAPRAARAGAPQQAS